MPNQDSGQKKGFDWIFIFVCIALGAVVVYLVRRIRAVERCVQKINKEASHRITQEDIGDAVKYYLETNPNYVTSVCMPYMHKPVTVPQPQPLSTIPNVRPMPMMHSPYPMSYPPHFPIHIPPSVPTPIITSTSPPKPNPEPIQEKQRTMDETDISLEDFNEEPNTDPQVVCDGDICYVVEKKSPKQDKEEPKETDHITFGITGDKQLDSMVSTTLNALLGKLQEIPKTQFAVVSTVDFGVMPFQEEEEESSGPTIEEIPNNTVEESILIPESFEQIDQSLKQ